MFSKKFPPDFEKKGIILKTARSFLCMRTVQSLFQLAPLSTAFEKEYLIHNFDFFVFSKTTPSQIWVFGLNELNCFDKLPRIGRYDQYLF